MRADRKKVRQSSRDRKVSRAMRKFVELLADDPVRPAASRPKARQRPAPRPKPKTPVRRRSTPHWDAKSRTLWFGPTLIKDFNVPARNQELILAAFEEQNWPDCIDDPLSPAPGIEPKRRLHDTIIRLNRSHKRRLIRFGGNGNGLAIVWRRLPRETRTQSAPKRL
jgi:hypothetical protein